MPISTAHPFAGVILKRALRDRVYFPALIIGSIVPDLAACIDNWEYFSHTLLGSLVFCLPVGLLTLWLFHMLRIPLVQALPNPHRNALTPLCASGPPTNLNMVSSLLLGAWAHIIWDLFTHDHSWLLMEHPILKTPVMGISLHKLIWAISSVAGSAGILVLYARFVSTKHRSEWTLTRTDLSAYVFWCAVAIVPLAAAIPSSLLDPATRSGFSLRILAMYYLGWAYITIAVTGFVLRSRGVSSEAAIDDPPR